MTRDDGVPDNLAPSLLRWYDAARRDLPWRRTADPYRIWLAEVMLQQTRVETVIPYYERFVERFPTVASLAAASVEEVLEAWVGLGYYGRARRLHAAARQVVAEHEGRVPRDPAALRALPGVGRYTAGAVLSIAYGLRVPVVDGNVERVLCRLFGLEGNPKAGPTRRRLWTLAGSLIPADRAGEFNQAMMELGATVCTPKAPACEACPVSARCEARRLGRQAELPELPPRKAVPHYDVGVGLVWRRGKVLIARRPPDVMLGGLWEFPGGKREDGEAMEETVRRELAEELGLEVTVRAPFVTCKHAYSHFTVTLHAFHCACPRGRVRPTEADAFRWVGVSELADFPFPAGSVKIIRELERGRGLFAPGGEAGE
ncbi:MAG: A/G-specific adenine glycosylase [Planctomycetota bacterium]